KTGIGDDLAIVLGFKIVYVGAVAVHARPNGVAGAVREVLSIARIGNVLARSLVNLPSGNAFFSGESLLHLPDAGIAPAGDDIEDLHLLFRGRAQSAGPGNVVIDGIGCVLLGPNVEQDVVAGLDLSRTLRARLIMRVAAVRVRGDDRQVF